MKRINYIAVIFILAMVGSAQAISFHDYYHGNAELGIPPHEKEINAAIATRHLRLISKGLTDLIGFNEVPGVAALREVDFTDNLLTELPNNIFHNLPALVILNLNGNELNSLPRNIFHGLTKLEYLYLQSNKLTALPENIFHGLTALLDLHLASNQLTTLPTNIFSGLTALEMLDLGRNPLTELPENIFHNLKRLQILLLNDNQLATLPENIFQGLTALRDLYLYDNELTTLADNIFHGLTALQSLNLNNNQFTALSAHIFNGLTILEDLHLENNPIPLTQAQLRKELQLPGSVELLFKTPEQQRAEQELFTAIENADALAVRQRLVDIRARWSHTERGFRTIISKIRDANGDNILHAAIKDAAERIRLINGMSAGLPEGEKQLVKQVQEEQKREINDRYMKVIRAIFSCGELCVQDMLFTPNAEGQLVIDSMVAKLGFDSPITQAIFSVLNPEEEKKIRMEEAEALTHARPKRTLEQPAPETEKPKESMADVAAVEKEQEEEAEGRKRQRHNEPGAQ